MSLGHAYQVNWGLADRPGHDTFVLFAEGPDDADAKAREVLAQKYPGRYEYTVLRVVRSGSFEVLPDKDFEKPG